MSDAHESDSDNNNVEESIVSKVHDKTKPEITTQAAGGNPDAVDCPTTQENSETTGHCAEKEPSYKLRHCFYPTLGSNRLFQDAGCGVQSGSSWYNSPAIDSTYGHRTLGTPSFPMGLQQHVLVQVCEKYN